MILTDEKINQYNLSHVNKDNIPYYTKVIEQMNNNLPYYIKAISQVYDNIPNYAKAINQEYNNLPNYIKAISQVCDNIPSYVNAIDQVYTNLPYYLKAVDQINNNLSNFIDYYKYTSEKINSIYIPEYKRISDSVNIVVSNLKTQFPESFFYEDIYSSIYSSLYKTINEIKAKEPQNVLEPIQFDVVDIQEGINYPIENHKDAIGLPELFKTISKEDAISFINYISQYPYLASNHKVGKQILKELSELAKNSLEEIENIVLFRGRIWTEKQEMDFTVDEMWQPPSGTPEMGRFNPIGISYLYMSDTEQTVISELKESGKFSILKTSMTRKSIILDITKFNGYIFELCNKQKVGNVAKPKEYLIPNYIAQCCSFLTKEKDVKIEGIRYKSSMVESKGYNYVFFNKFRDSFNKEEIILIGNLHAQ